MKIVLGTVQFGLSYGVNNPQGIPSEDEIKSILKTARNAGIDTLDTATEYGDSEKKIGEYSGNQFKVITKLPAVPAGTDDVGSWMYEIVARSIQRLETEQLYGILLHRPHQLLDDGGTSLYSSLKQIQSEGLVKKIGISVYSPEELDRLLFHYDFDIVQAPFNIIDNRLVDSGWMKKLNGMGTELHVRSIFLQGLLLMDNYKRASKFDTWQPLWSRYHDWLRDNNLTAMQACLRYALSFSEINKVVVGVDSHRHLTEILAALGSDLPKIPDYLYSDDLRLLNPQNWASLK